MDQSDRKQPFFYNVEARQNEHAPYGCYLSSIETAGDDSGFSPDSSEGRKAEMKKEGFTASGLRRPVRR
jgi:hypothetical protein